MKSRKSELAVCVSERTELHRFLGTMQDWSALGLLNDFVFVDAASEDSAHGPECVFISAGRVATGRLNRVLAELSGLERVRVACLSQVAETFSSVGFKRGSEFFQAIGETVPSAQLSRIHAISVTEPDSWPTVPPDDLAWIGAHNLVLAPENSKSPTAGVVGISVDERMRPVGLSHQVAALCSAVGLWTGESRTFVDEEPPTGAARVMALRTWTRHLSLGRVRADLVSQVIDMSEAYPLPVATDQTVSRITDELAAADKMAATLIALHGDTLDGKRSVAQEVSGGESSFGHLVKYFFIFLWGALRFSPRALLDKATQKTAAAAQWVLTGNDEQTAIVGTLNGIRGIGRDGKISNPDRLDSALKRLLELIAEDGVAPVNERYDFSKFWKDFSAGAFTLLDGRRRSDRLALDITGRDIFVVSKPSSVAPNPYESFKLGDDARRISGVSELKPSDVDTAQLLIDLFQSHAKAGTGQGNDLSAEADRIADWREKIRGSYVAEVGDALSERLERARADVVKNFERVDKVHSDGKDLQSEVRMQKAIAGRLLAGLGLFLVAVGTSIWMAYDERIQWNTQFWLLPTLALFWFGLSLAYFYRTQNKMLKRVLDRQNTAERIKVARSNLLASLQDVRRLQVLYRQYVSWAQAISAFVWRPYGLVSENERPDYELGEGYCHNHQFGVLSPQSGVIETVSRQLRSKIFPVGWLDGAWEHFLAQVPVFRDQHLVQEDKEILFTDRSISQQSVLEQWSEAILADNRSGANSVISDRITAVLEERTWDFVDSLFGEVVTRSVTGARKTESYKSFAEDLHDVSDGGPARGYFTARLFSPVESTAGRNVVAKVLVSGGRGYVRPLIVTQRSEYFDPRDLVFGQPPVDPGQLGNGETESGSVPQV